MLKQIIIKVSEGEYQAHRKRKGARTWREYLLGLSDVNEERVREIVREEIEKLRG